MSRFTDAMRPIIHNHMKDSVSLSASPITIIRYKVWAVGPVGETFLPGCMTTETQNEKLVSESYNPGKQVSPTGTSSPRIV